MVQYQMQPMHKSGVVSEKAAHMCFFYLRQNLDNTLKMYYFDINYKPYDLFNIHNIILEHPLIKAFNKRPDSISRSLVKER